MRPKQPIPFGEFAPDRSKISGQSQLIKGCLPLSGRYAPLPDLQQVRAGSMLNDGCLGGCHVLPLDAPETTIETFICVLRKRLLADGHDNARS